MTTTTDTNTRRLPESHRWVLNRLASNLDSRLPFPSVAVEPDADTDNPVRVFWYARSQRTSFVVSLISDPNKKEDSVFSMVGDGEPFDTTESGYPKVSASMQYLGQLAQSQGVNLKDDPNGFSCRVDLSENTIWQHINTVLLGIQISHTKTDGKDWQREADKLETQVPRTKSGLQYQTALGVVASVAVIVGVGVFFATGAQVAINIVSIMVLAGVGVGFLASKNLFRLRKWSLQIAGMRHPDALPGQGSPSV